MSSLGRLQDALHDALDGYEGGYGERTNGPLAGMQTTDGSNLTGSIIDLIIDTVMTAGWKYDFSSRRRAGEETPPTREEVAKVVASAHLHAAPWPGDNLKIVDRLVLCGFLSVSDPVCEAGHRCCDDEAPHNHLWPVDACPDCDSGRG